MVIKNLNINKIYVKILAYLYKFKGEPDNYHVLSSALFYPVIKDGIEYYMVGRNTNQQFYLGADDEDQIWKMVESNKYDELTEIKSYDLMLEKVPYYNLGNIGHW